MRYRIVLITALLSAGMPSAAYAVTDVPPILATGAGVLGLLFACALLVAMLSLRKIAEGAAIAENIKWAVLAVLCLTASLLAGWVARWLPEASSAEYARLGADLLSVVALAFFGIYFMRVRHAMNRFLARLTGEEQLLAAVVDPDLVESVREEV